MQAVPSELFDLPLINVIDAGDQATMAREDGTGTAHSIHHTPKLPYYLAQREAAGKHLLRTTFDQSASIAGSGSPTRSRRYTGSESRAPNRNNFILDLNPLIEDDFVFALTSPAQSNLTAIGRVERPTRSVVAPRSYHARDYCSR